MPTPRPPSGNSPRRPVEKEMLVVEKEQPAEAVGGKAKEMALVFNLPFFSEKNKVTLDSVTLIFPLPDLYFFISLYYFPEHINGMVFMKPFKIIAIHMSKEIQSHLLAKCQAHGTTDKTDKQHKPKSKEPTDVM
ncbi:UNVERIFIED_CONTAM: hypothetical protein K2H54_044910 [Gekko kuhli]